MYTKRTLQLVLALVVVATILVAGVANAQESTEAAPAAVLANMGTAFTYQGRLVDDSNPANGVYDFQFSLFDASGGGSQIGSTQPLDDVGVSEGLFTVDLDFGAGAFDGQARWLEVAVKRDADGGYTTLAPRVALSPAPYALALPGLWTRQNATSPNLIGGYHGNVISAGVLGSTIGGGGNSGNSNQIHDTFGSIGGGTGNVVGADDGNATFQQYATVGGGLGNTASQNRATVSGGHSNTASGAAATVGGGTDNTAGSYSATVGGGRNNDAAADYATIAGGGPSDPANAATTNNRVHDDYGTIGGGGGNVVGVDDGNTANQLYATVGGGLANTANYAYATVSGGQGNTASGDMATVAGGFANTASHYSATVGGGRNNSAAADYATIAGGGPSDQANPTTTNNRVHDDYGTIGGGGGNVVGTDDGDSTNQYFATVGGGQLNTASYYYATVGGGGANTASAPNATVGGGYLI